jgi:two-component system chemotaxis response regulator CheY
MNILLVDDSDIIRSMIKRTIVLSGLSVGTVHEAANGKEALAVMRDEWVDLVLADLNMPVMDGAEMLSAMREDPDTAQMPVIIVSTEGATQRIDDLSSRGVSAWVRKPFTPEEIRDVILGVTGSWETDPATDESLDRIFGHVMETFAYSFPEPLRSGETPTPDGDVVCAEIDFVGAISGALSVAAPGALCRDIAAGLLGLEPDDAEAATRGADTLAEVLNITAGHLCTDIEPHTPTHLRPPTAARMAPDEWQAFCEAPRTRMYLIDEHPVAVRLDLRPTSARA